MAVPLPPLNFSDTGQQATGAKSFGGLTVMAPATGASVTGGLPNLVMLGGVAVAAAAAAWFLTRRR